MRTTSNLKELATELWCVESEVWDKGIHARLRTPIVRLKGGELWLYSPGPMDEAVVDQINGLGPVAHLVAPNLNHHKFLHLASEHFPDAKVWGPPGLEPKCPHLSIDEIIDGAVDFGPSLHGLMLEGVSFSREIVFRHSPTGTLLCADLVQNIHDEPSFWTRQIWRMIGSWKTFGQNRYWRARTEPAVFRQSVDEVLSWDFERIVMAHGDVVETGGRAMLQEALGWVAPEPAAKP